MGAPFTLAVWNVFQGLHHHSRRYRMEPNPGVRDHLEAMDADVLVLPEAWRFGRPEATWAEAVAADLGYELHQWVSARPGRPRESVPWRMVVLTRVAVRRLPDVVFSGYPDAASRAALRLQLIDAGVTLAAVHQYGIHLLHRGHWRAWLQERREFRAVCAAHDIVAGDMNMWGPVVRRDAAGLRSAVRGRTYRANRPHSQIDHILVSDRVAVLSSAVLPDMGSDHLALRVTLRPQHS